MPRESESLATERQALEALGHKLATFRAAADWTQGRLATALYKSRSSIAHIEAGRQPAPRDFWEQADHLLRAAGALVAAFEEFERAHRTHVRAARRHSRAALITQADQWREAAATIVPAPQTTEALVTPPDPVKSAADAAQESLAFASWAETDRIGATTMDHLNAELTRVAGDYVHAPLTPLFADLLKLRDTAFGLLRERPHPRQAREMFFLAGTTCVLLAHATQNLGDSSSAMAQARTAATCAEQADHDGLRAWVCGTQALIAEWTRHPQDAVQLARQGQQHAWSTDSRVRLAALEARTLARTGDREGVINALDRAERARDARDQPDELGNFGGLLTFPLVKQRYYTGGALTLVGEYDRAENAALDAIAMYEKGPAEQRSYGDEALARVDIATARLAQDDLDGAHAALRPVLELSPTRRIQQLGVALENIRSTLSLPRYAHATVTRELTEEIETFTSAQPAIPPPR